MCGNSKTNLFQVFCWDNIHNNRIWRYCLWNILWSSSNSDLRYFWL